VAQQMITPYRAENWWCIERIFAPKYYGGLLLHCKSPFQLWKFQNPCRIGARGTWWLWSSLLPTKRLSGVLGFDIDLSQQGLRNGGAWRGHCPLALWNGGICALT